MSFATNFCRPSILLLLLLSSGVCCANGWVSGVNAFRTTPDFYFIFAAIIAVEWIVLWRMLRSMGVLGALWRALAINAASSAAGDILFRIGWAPSSGTVWLQAISFFFLTVAIELPFLLLLLRRSAHGWRLISLVVLAGNVTSHALLVAIDRPVRQAWLSRVFSHDQMIVRQWTNTQMFGEAKGRLYATESANGGPPHRLRYFNFSEQRWESISNSPAVHPNVWDVEGNLLAYQTYGEASSGNVIRVTTLPQCHPIHELKLPSNGYRSTGGGEIAFSPDGKKLAVLAPMHEIQIPLSGSSYRVYGRSCLVVVYDLATGKHAICPRRALHTIRWLADSERLLFHAPADENLLGSETLPKPLQKQYDLDDPEKNPFARPEVFSYRYATDEVTSAPEITARMVGVQGNHVTCWSNASLIMLNFTNQTRRILTLDTISPFSGPVVSPDNHFAVLSFQLNRFTSLHGYLAIVDLENPSQRYHLGRLFYRLDWTTTGIEPSQ